MIFSVYQSGSIQEVGVGDHCVLCVWIRDKELAYAVVGPAKQNRSHKASSQEGISRGEGRAIQTQMLLGKASAVF